MKIRNKYRLDSVQLIDFAIEQVLDMRIRRAIKHSAPHAVMEQRARKANMRTLRNIDLFKTLGKPHG